MGTHLRVLSERVYIVFKNLCIPVLWTRIALALEGLLEKYCLISLFGVTGMDMLSSHDFNGWYCLSFSMNVKFTSLFFQEASSWLPGVTSGGHFSSVQDICWEPEKGQFLVSASQDQTTRLHSVWKNDSTQNVSNQALSQDLETGCPKLAILKNGSTQNVSNQALSQDLETGCPELAIVKYLGVLFFKGDHKLLRLQP